MAQCGHGKCKYTTTHSKQMRKHWDNYHGGQQPGQTQKEFRGDRAQAFKKKK